MPQFYCAFCGSTGSNSRHCSKCGSEAALSEVLIDKMSNTQTRKRLEKALDQLGTEPQTARSAIERLFAELRHERSAITVKLEEMAQRYDAVAKEAKENRGLLQDIKVENEALRQKLTNRDVALANATPIPYTPPDYSSLTQCHDYGHLKIKLKCMKCGLRFVICTWYENLHTRHTIHCPECGQHSGYFLVWSEKTVDYYIFSKLSLVRQHLSMQECPLRRNKRISHANGHSPMRGENGRVGASSWLICREQIKMCNPHFSRCRLACIGAAPTVSTECSVEVGVVIATGFDFQPLDNGEYYVTARLPAVLHGGGAIGLFLWCIQWCYFKREQIYDCHFFRVDPGDSLCQRRIFQRATGNVHKNG